MALHADACCYLINVFVYNAKIVFMTVMLVIVYNNVLAVDCSGY